MTGLRERKKARTRRELAEAARSLFHARGYEETTVEDIAEVVGVSSRTFFRYFDSKEAVLFAGWEDQLDELAEFLRARPPGEPLLESVKALAMVMVSTVEADRDEHLFVKEIVAKSPTAGDYEARVLLPAYRETFVRVAMERAGDGDDLKPALAAAVGVAAMHEAKRRWMEDPSQSLNELMTASFDALEDLVRGR